MSAETDKAMEQAPQAAVARMNNRSSSNGSSGTDPVSLLMAILPKLLERKEDDREDVLEKIEGLQTEELASLREQLRGARKQLQRVIKSQELVLNELRELREQQAAVGNAVLHLAQEMSRVEILGETPEVAEPDLYEGLSSSIAGDPVARRAAGEQKRSQQKTRKNPRHERS